jgi:hypothetical protein
MADRPFSRLTPVGRVPIAFQPGAVSTDDAIWAPAPGGLVRVDPKTNGAPAAPERAVREPRRRIPQRVAPLCVPGRVARVDLKSSDSKGVVS